MKRIAIPDPVTLAGPDGNPIAGQNGESVTMSLASFIENTLLADPVWGADLASVRLSQRIAVAVHSAVDGAMLLDDAGHERLVAVMQKPSNPYHPLFARQLMPMFDAIEGAQEERLG